MSPLRLLAVSGSLRARSSNTELLRAAAMVAPSDAQVVFYRGLADLPAFNPDLDGPADPAPAAVAALRAEVAAADALLVCSPEYAHGVAGALKNALDWLVSGPDIPGKPIGVLNASGRATHAHASLVEIFRTMGATVVPEACVVVPLDGRRLDATGMAADASLAPALARAVDALTRVAAARQGARTA